MGKITEIKEKSGIYSAMIFDLCEKLMDNKEYLISGRLILSSANMDKFVKEAENEISREGAVEKLVLAEQEARETKHYLRVLNKTSRISADYNIYLRNIEDLIDSLYREVKPVKKRNFQKTGGI